MYRLLLVDDEEEVRKGIIQKINWSQFQFEIAGEAENGREALDLIEDDVPDVVITDITMPLMNGLELASILKDQFPTVKTVILTGFDDFKFAQQAIKYGVADYVLKPVMPRDMEELVGKLRQQLEEERVRKEDVTMLRRHYTESLPIIKDKFLVSLITGISDKNDANRKISSFGFRLSGNAYLAAAAGIDKSSLRNDGKSSLMNDGKSNLRNDDKDSLKNNVFEENDIELLKFAILNIAREIAGKHSFGEVFYNDDNLVFLAGSAGVNASALPGISFTVLEEIRQNVEKYLKIQVTIGLGRVCDSLQGLKESYRTALAALDYRLVIGGSKVIFIEDLEPKTAAEAIAFDEEKERALLSSIKFGTTQEVKSAIDALFRDLSGVRASMKDYRLYLTEITAAISKLSRSMQVDADELFGKDFELFRSKSAEEVKNWFEEVCLRLMRQIAGKRQNTTALLWEKAKDYIREHYGDNELSIQKLADYLHISPSYLSMIFKKDAGVSFLKYLVNIRLEAAKELLVNTDMKTSEIAERIGYPEINYFSYFFKKNFGMSPREYRNLYLHKKES